MPQEISVGTEAVAEQHLPGELEDRLVLVEDPRWRKKQMRMNVMSRKI